MVGREPAEPITPVEPTASALENAFSLVSRSVEAGSSVIHGRVVHSKQVLKECEVNNVSYIGISEARLHHILGVSRKAYKIAKDMGYDERFCRRCFMLGWIHDVGYEFSEKQSEHPNVSEGLLWTLGDAFGVIMEFPRNKNGEISSSAAFGEEWVNAVSAIKDHGLYSENETAEWKILNMADMQVDSQGNEVSVSQRLDDIKNRYGEHSDQYLTACDVCYRIGLTAVNFAKNIT